MMDAEESEWNRNLCSRILLVLQYATSTTSMLKDLRRVLCPDKTRNSGFDKKFDRPRTPARTFDAAAPDQSPKTPLTGKTPIASHVTGS